MMFTAIIVFFPTTRSPDVQEMNYTIVVVGGAMALAVGWYYLPKYGGVHWFVGPVPTVDGFKTKGWANDEVDDASAGGMEEKGDVEKSVTVVSYEVKQDA